MTPERSAHPRPTARREETSAARALRSPPPAAPGAARQRGTQPAPPVLRQNQSDGSTQRSNATPVGGLRGPASAGSAPERQPRKAPRSNRATSAAHRQRPIPPRLLQLAIPLPTESRCSSP